MAIIGLVPLLIYLHKNLNIAIDIYSKSRIAHGLSGMRMSLKNLLNRLVREGKLKRQDIDIGYIQNLLDAAKRNYCMYDPKILVSRTETEAIHKTAQEFWRMVLFYLSDKDPQLKLFDEI